MNFSADLIAGDKIKESQSVDLEGIVTINNVRGDVETLGWNRPAINIQGELDDLTKN